MPLALGLGHDPDYQRYLVPDEPNFCDVRELCFLLTEEDISLAGPRIGTTDRYFKIMQFVRRRADADSETFRAEWGRHKDEEVAAAALGVVRHVRCRAAPGTEPTAGIGYDAVRELWWSDATSFEAGRARAPLAWDELMKSDVQESSATLVVAVDEIRLLWPSSPERT